MQNEITGLKLKSATIVETIIALLILMFSFSAGMVIYTKLFANGINASELRADAELLFLMDSLCSSENIIPIKLVKNEHLFELQYFPYQGFPQLLLITMTCKDSNGATIRKRFRLITNREKNSN